MKSLKDVKSAAELEGISISQWYRTCIAPLKGFVETRVPSYISDDLLSQWCDARAIPCFIYMTGNASFHDSYCKLYEVERTK